MTATIHKRGRRSFEEHAAYMLELGQEELARGDLLKASIACGTAHKMIWCAQTFGSAGHVEISAAGIMSVVVAEMTALKVLSDRDVIQLIEEIARAAAPVPFTLGPDVHVNRAIALGAIMGICRVAREPDPELIIATIAGKTPIPMPPA